MHDLDPSKPAREIVSRSPTRSVGAVNAPWAQPSPVEHESDNERDYVVAALLCPWLSLMVHQPCTAQLGTKEYTPDFGQKFLDGTVAIAEVKMAHRVKENRTLFNDAASQFRAKGHEFYVVHDGQSTAEGRAERAEIVQKYGMHVVSSEKRKAIKEMVLAAGAKGLAFGQVMEKCKASRWDLLHLVCIRVISLDRYLHMSDDDHIYPNPKMPRNCAKHFGEWFGCSPWNDGGNPQ